MEKKDMNKTITAVVSVTLIIAIIVGSTFAYWQWITSDAQKTFVNVSVEDGISMSIIPTTYQNDKLFPVTRENCMDSVIKGHADITIVNFTDIEARPQFYLKLKIVNSKGQNITSEYAQYINYAVSEYIEPKEGEASYTCVNAPRYGTFNAERQTKDQYNQVVEGWYDSALITDILDGTGNDNNDETISTRFPILPTSDNLDSITFSAPGDTTTSHRFNFWAWIDSSYTATNQGETVGDQLQDAKITISWSDASIVKQVDTE